MDDPLVEYAAAGAGRGQVPHIQKQDEAVLCRQHVVQELLPGYCGIGLRKAVALGDVPEIPLFPQ